MNLTAAALAKVIVPVGLLLLGANGLLDVRLQHDMDQKAVQLTQNVRHARTLSGQLGQGLHGLGQLATTTKQMQANLATIEQSSLGMATGLAELSQTVAGINASVSTIDTGVGQSQSSVASIAGSLQHILKTLQSLNSVNGDVVKNLGVMLADENSIRQNLVQMNQKTALVP